MTDSTPSIHTVSHTVTDYSIYTHTHTNTDELQVRSRICPQGNWMSDHTSVKQRFAYSLRRWPRSGNFSAVTPRDCIRWVSTNPGLLWWFLTLSTHSLSRLRYKKTTATRLSASRKSLMLWECTWETSPTIVDALGFARIMSFKNCLAHLARRSLGQVRMVNLSCSFVVKSRAPLFPASCETDQPWLWRFIAKFVVPLRPKPAPMRMCSTCLSLAFLKNPNNNWILNFIDWID